MSLTTNQRCVISQTSKDLVLRRKAEITDTSQSFFKVVSNFTKSQNIHIIHSRTFDKLLDLSRNAGCTSYLQHYMCAANFVHFDPRCQRFRWITTEVIWNFVYPYAYMTVLKMYKLGFANDFEPRSTKRRL
jgi:hypothetical protein